MISSIFQFFPLFKQQDDYFARLPDDVVILILNRLIDAKLLCRCLVVSKRFASLIPQVEIVALVGQPRRWLCSLYPPATKKSSSRIFLKSLFAKLFNDADSAEDANFRPYFTRPDDLSLWICNSIRNFAGIRHLLIELPDTEGIRLYRDTGGLIKWSAEFGKEFVRCEVIQATLFKKPCPKSDPNPNRIQTHNKPMLSDEMLQSRFSWSRLCLRAACVRHGVAREAVVDCADLRSVVVVDGRRQGRLSMNEKQIKELRESMNSPAVKTVAPIMERTKWPEVTVTLWYAEELVLPTSGHVMKDASVTAIRRETGQWEDDGDGEKECEMLKGGFGGDKDEEAVIREAVTEILKSKCKVSHTLEMKFF